LPFHHRLMTKLAALALALVTGAGCYASTGYGYGTTGYYGGSTSYGETGVVAYGSPPPAEVVDVDLYYDQRPGYVYVNGRHTWVNNQWVWQNGYYEPERVGHVYVQGYWNNGRWQNGYWAPNRVGYTYVDGYWDRRGRGHVWVNGGWQANRNDGSYYQRGGWTSNGGVRSYNRGGWVRGNAGVRVNGSVNTGGRGTVIRDHRR
jgi:hypothetical protein